MIVKFILQKDIPKIYKLILKKIRTQDLTTYAELRKELSKIRFTREEMEEIIRELKLLKLLEDHNKYIRIRKPLGTLNIPRITRWFRVILWR